MATAQLSNNNTPVVVIGDQGVALTDATVRWSVDGSPYQAAPGNGAGYYFIEATDTKVSIIVEHASYGSQHFEATLPELNQGTVVMNLDGEGISKMYANDRLVDFRRVAEPGDVVIVNPPGQGCQLPDQQGHGGGGIIAATSDVDAGFVVAENFVPINDGAATHAHWWGSYYNFSLGQDCAPGPGDNFTITYYADDAGGSCPGTVIGGPFSVGLRQKNFTGNLLAGFLQEWEFESTFHDPVPMAAGTCYWIEIVNDTAGDPNCFWLWNTAPPGDNRSCQSGAPTDFDQAFCINFQTTSDGCGAPPGPDNDDFGNCEAISGEGLFNFDNGTATTDGPDNGAACVKFGSSQIENDVWFCWTAPCTDNVTINTCSLTTVDTRLAAYDGVGAPSIANLLACNDDTCGLQSQISFAATAGNQYLIRVGTFPGASGGTGQFNITCGGGGGGPQNDACADAEAIAIGGTASGTTVGAASDGLAFCGASEGTGGTVWYSVVGNGSRLSATFCAGGGSAQYDSKLHVYCGSCAALTCIAGNDDTCGLSSEVRWDSNAGESYLIAVHGFSSANGTFTLAIVDLGAPTGGPSCTPLTHGGLDVGANLSDVFVGVQPPDNYLRTSGLTPFNRTFDLLTEVEIVAPTQWDGRDLLGFLVDGVRIVRADDGLIRGRMNNDRSVKAIYGEPAGNNGGVLRR